MENIKTYWVPKDADGTLRPQAHLWPGGEMKKYYQSEIDKYMKKAGEGESVVEVKLIEVN